ncbi:heme/hemin ABC transporter substrate-binding protein [Pseudomonas sp. EL_65y_Pfl2_R95]|uniref:heme/hemin ABC transporter substrate-binding protein n=1 Tax=Pseudomonas sp. EL_65y_Pfl2_R95 TaxID=3088698 RepID=UPI0030D98669
MWIGRVVVSLAAGLMFWGIAQAEPLPQRWVSAGGSISEWVVELGGESKLVGVDTTSQHPAALRELPSIGYQRQLAVEGILALKPDVMIGSDEMGPPPVLSQLQGAGVNIERLSVSPQLSALQGSLQRIGELLGDPPRATQVFAAYQQRLERQQQWVSQAQAKQTAPKVLLLLGHTGGSPMAGGIETSADWIIKQAGGINLATHRGYKALSSEALIGLDPQVIVIADRSLEGEQAKQALLKHNPALAATRAARDGRLISLDPTLLVGGLGPRLPDGLAALSAAFYPERQPLTADAKLTP